MDTKTHEFKTIKYIMDGTEGTLTGEFIKNTDVPDGRIYFKANFHQGHKLILGYFSGGVL